MTNNDFKKSEMNAMWDAYESEDKRKQQVMKDKCTQSFQDLNGRPANGFKFKGKYIND